jgi:outer membrane protein OmpA-like peptidoglycan-associated protein/tetratricopeptide (TPR) repeat protein
MHLKKYCHFLISCIAGSLLYSGAVAQNTLKIADGYYDRGDYSSAAKYYEQAVAGTKDADLAHAPYQLQKASNETVATIGGEVFYRLAESHRMLYRHAEAAKWYGKVVESKSAGFPLAGLYYGESLLASGKYQESENALRAFLREYKPKDLYRARAEKTIANLAFMKGLKPNESLVLKKTTLGDTGADYAATWANAGTLLFTSTRSYDGKTYRNALYTGNGAHAATRLPLMVGEPDFGAGAVSPDGKRLYFMATGTVEKTEKKHATIYMSEKTDSAWTVPVALNAAVNAGNNNARQPFVSSDGKWLFFSSDRPGGRGGYDIWYAPLSADGQPGKAVNAGVAVNTKGNEEAPFYHTASATLVFASDSHPGMGGYDLFTTTGSVGNWAAPVNMGMPVNSTKDDLYFVSRSKDLLEDAMLSSDRASDCCLQTFALGKLPPVLPVKKVDTTTTIVAASIPAGTITTSVVEANAADAAAPGMFDSSNTFVSRAILFDFNETVIKSSSLPLLDQLVRYLQNHPLVQLEVGAYTDGKGTAAYNLDLSKKRAATCIRYLIQKGIAADRLTAKGFGECCPLEKETDAAGNDIESAREKNRRVVMKLLK